MVTISNIAQRVLNENNYTTSDITVVNLEYLIDNAVDHINMETGRSISHVNSNNLTANYDELMVIKTLSSLMIRAYLDKGPNIAIQSLSVAAVIGDPHYKLYTRLVNQGINRLRGRSFLRT